jgi:hypothetical protein
MAVKRLNGSLKRFPLEAKVYYEMGPNGQEQIGKAQYVKVWGDDELGVLFRSIARFAPQVTKPRTRCKTRRMGSINQLVQQVLRGCCNFRNPPTLSVTYLSGCKAQSWEFLTSSAGMLLLQPH